MENNITKPALSGTAPAGIPAAPPRRSHSLTHKRNWQASGGAPVADGLGLSAMMLCELADEPTLMVIATPADRAAVVVFIASMRAALNCIEEALPDR